MEVVAELFVGLGAGCQSLQRRAYAHLQVLLDDSAAGPAVRWAGGPIRGCNAAPKTAAPFLLGPLGTASTAWASRRPQLSYCNPQPRCHGSAGRLASLSVGGGSPAAAAISIAAEPERRDRGHKQQQQQPAGSVKQQQAMVALQQEKQHREADEPLHEGWSQLRLMAGTWIRNRDSSDSMEDAMNLMRLNGIVRQAVKLVRGVRIDTDTDNFTFTVFSVISWFKVKEMYPLSGEERQYRRRDLRRGGAMGRVEPHGQDVRLQLRWNDPFGGKGRDHFRLISEDELHIESIIEVGGQTACYRTVYNRKPNRHNRRNRHGDQAAGQQGQHGQGHQPCRDAHLASASTELGEVDDGGEEGAAGRR